MLISLLRGNAGTTKYAEIDKLVADKKNCVIKNRLFHSPSFKTDEIKTLTDIKFDTEKVDFNSDRADAINIWAREHGDFKGIEKGILSGVNFALANFAVFKGEWCKPISEGCTMKVINSFNYTEDIKYEVRFLELPMQDPDFNLVIIVPNETDVLHTLFRRLTTDGLTAAVTSIQPSFTTSSKLKAPNIMVTSETELSLEDIPFNGSAVQYGNVKIDENGTSIKVLTCLYSPETNAPITHEEEPSQEKLPFFFALVFKDTPIFTGQYLD